MRDAIKSDNLHSGSSSSMYFTTYDQITAEFHCSRKMATLGLSLFILAQGTGPLILAPLTEVIYHFIFFITLKNLDVGTDAIRFMAAKSFTESR